MSEFISKLKRIYEEEKDLPNPPSYLNDIKDILNIEQQLNED